VIYAPVSTWGEGGRGGLPPSAAWICKNSPMLSIVISPISLSLWMTGKAWHYRKDLLIHIKE
jgi:hypothetical protein